MPSYPALVPMYGLGSYGRVIGAVTLSGPRSSSGSALRVYAYLKQTKGNTYALNFFKNATFGPYFLNKNGTGLVWN
uniref:Uncharacterized protein n=1 Tax=viral metagenome TaxID=1070528 RepID=A0A6C0ERX3_9ZZZZ